MGPLPRLRPQASGLAPPLCSALPRGLGDGVQARPRASASCPAIRVCLLPPPSLPLTLLWERVAMLMAVLKLKRQRTT